MEVRAENTEVKDKNRESRGIKEEREKTALGRTNKTAKGGKVNTAESGTTFYQTFRSSWTKPAFNTSLEPLFCCLEPVFRLLRVVGSWGAGRVCV